MGWTFYDSSGHIQETRVPSSQLGVLEVVLDGLGAVIQPGVALDLPVNFSGTWTGWEITSRVSGSIVLDIWKDSTWPPSVADTIIGGGGTKPTLSGATRAVSSSLTGWTTAFAAGDILTINVDSASSVVRVTLALKYLRG